MDSLEASKTASQSPNPNSPVKPHSTGARQRVISSCLTCRRRKVKCDHGHPVCGACSRGNHTCAYAVEQGLAQAVSGRVAKPSPLNGKGGRSTDIQTRLDRLELLLEQAASGQVPSEELRCQISGHVKHDSEHQVSPSSASQASQGAGISFDNHDGTLLLGEGQSRFVSSMHYALLADEIQDIKALLGDKSIDEEREIRDMPTRNNLLNYLSLGRARMSVSLAQLLPHSQQHRDILLDIYFSNVDPMVRITHKPTLVRKFSQHIQEAHPIVWAVFYSVINSLPPSVCKEKFGDNKDELLARYELGVEISLSRANYMTTSNLEVLQGFLLWLTCITKEDDMGKAWALLGVTIRVGLNQGLHRDPSLFPHGSMDAITIETRRRLWYQICYLEYRAAEVQGQEPSISDEDFTTLLPRNIEDDDLIEGASPGPTPYDEHKFTTMTFQLLRFTGNRSLRLVVQSTYRLERRMLESGLHGTSCPDPVQELQNIYKNITTMVDQMHEENEKRFLQFCNPEIPIQRLCLSLATSLEWRCYLLFWLRMPRAYRDIVFSDDIRKSIFTKSVNYVETVNGASIDVEVATRFQWHIGGHAAFQAIMHILSELRNPQFDAPDRQRALRALQMSQLLKEDNTTKAWAVVKGMIDKVLGEQFSSRSSPSEGSSSSYPSPSNAYPSPSTAVANNPATVGQMPIQYVQPYAFQAAPNLYGAPAAQSIHHAQPPLQESQFNWNDINLNSIVGDVGQQNPPMNLYDWGFWGDPVNFNDQTNMPFPMDTDPYAPFWT